MIFAAFSGSRVWILEKTILVASYASMEVVSFSIFYLVFRGAAWIWGRKRGDGYLRERESNKREV